MITNDLARALDPARFMMDAGFAPDPWQRDFLRATALRTLLLCARQTGKSTVTAALASHVALFEPGALVLLFAPSQNQSRELYRKVLSFHRQASNTDPDAESAQRLELSNGSRIISLSGNPVSSRGYSAPRLIIIDEAAFLDDALYYAITPMLAAGGRLIAMTTPCGKRGFFYDAWTNGGDVWHRTKITAFDTSRMSPDFLEATRATTPDWRFSQEFLCEFVDNDETLFGSDMVSAAMSPDVAPIFSSPFTWS